MSVLKSKLGVVIAGCYALIISIVLYYDFQSHESDFWSWASLALTLPWSVGVVFIGFLLIHMSSSGMECGFAFCAVFNTIILYLAGDLFSRRHEH